MKLHFVDNSLDTYKNTLVETHKRICATHPKLVSDPHEITIIDAPENPESPITIIAPQFVYVLVLLHLGLKSSQERAIYQSAHEFTHCAFAFARGFPWVDDDIQLENNRKLRAEEIVSTAISLCILKEQKTFEAYDYLINELVNLKKKANKDLNNVCYSKGVDLALKYGFQSEKIADLITEAPDQSPDISELLHQIDLNFKNQK